MAAERDSTSVKDELPLLLGSGLVSGRLSSSDFRLVLSGTPMIFGDLGLGRLRRLPAESQVPSELVFAAHDSTLYYMDHQGISALDLRSGVSRAVAQPPQIEIDEAAQADALRDLPEELRTQYSQTSFRWILALLQDREELLTLAARPGGTDRIVRLRTDGTAQSSFVLEGWPGGLAVCSRRGRICQPGHHDGARIVDLQGQVRFSLSAGSFWDSAIHPHLSLVALSLGPEGQLGLWDLAGGTYVNVDPLGHSPAWSSYGRHLYYLHDDHELWTLETAAPAPRRLLALDGNGCASFKTRGGSYATAPVPSPDGRSLYAQLTRTTREDPEVAEALRHEHMSRGGSLPDSWGRFRSEHTACVLDLETGVVHQAPGHYYHNIAWLEPPVPDWYR